MSEEEGWMRKRESGVKKGDSANWVNQTKYWDACPIGAFAL